jgi:hypothetical protein
MAKTRNILKLQGTIDGLTFYLYKGKPCVRRKSSLDKSRWSKDPAFTNPRRSATHFGIASKASKIFRDAISPFAQAFGDTSFHNRLTASIAAAIKVLDPDTLIAGVDFRALAPVIKAVPFHPAHPFNNTVKLDLAHYVSPSKTSVRCEFVSIAKSLFTFAPWTTHFRLHIIYAPLKGGLARRQYKSDMDLADQATWSSDWLDCNQPFKICEQIDIPSFMLGDAPIALLLAIEPSTEDGAGHHLLERGKVMQLLEII